MSDHFEVTTDTGVSCNAENISGEEILESIPMLHGGMP
jgi:hypothetical protein